MIRSAVALSLLALGVLTLGIRAQGQAKPTKGPSLAYGQVVDVYGLRTRNGNTVRVRFRAGVLIGPRLRTQHSESLATHGRALGYRFLSSNPDSLRGRLLIEQEIGSAEFREVLDRLDDEITELNLESRQHVIPRNAVIRLTLPSPVTQSRAVLSEAIQILALDKAQAAIPLQLVARDKTILIDPVIYGTEAVRRGTSAALGLPAAKGTQANFRLLIDLAKLQPGARPIAWYFRSANHADTNADMSAGVLRNPEPPRILGEMNMFLERVDPIQPDTKLLTIFRDGIRQDLKQGDILRLYGSKSKLPIAALEVLQDAVDPLGRAAQVRVRALVQSVRVPGDGDLLEKLDPSRLAEFPKRAGKRRDVYLRSHAPRLVLLTAYAPQRGDRARNFVRFSANDPAPPEPEPRHDNKHIPPLANCVVRFSKPMDLASLDTLDTIYFASKPRPTTGAQRTRHLIHSLLLAVDHDGMAFRLQPPLGFCLSSAMRKSAAEERKKPYDRRRHQYYLNLIAGKIGIKDSSGLALAHGFSMGFSLDPKAATNLVGSRVIQFVGK